MPKFGNNNYKKKISVASAAEIDLKLSASAEILIRRSRP